MSEGQEPQRRPRPSDGLSSEFASSKLVGNVKLNTAPRGSLARVVAEGETGLLGVDEAQLRRADGPNAVGPGRGKDAS